MTEIIMASTILMGALKIVIDYNKKLIKTTTMFTYETVFLVCIYLVFNREAIQVISELLGFELPSNFILLILIVIGLWANYLNQRRVRFLEMQIVKLSRVIAINGSRFEE
jgi:hypothetical protein